MSKTEPRQLRCDTLIRNALLIDGSGSEAFPADVALAAGRIAAIGAPGELDAWHAEVVINAAGNVLSPGFIDVHTHDDTNVIRMPEMFPKLSQGVTTVVVGNCGISAAPVGAGQRIFLPLVCQLRSGYRSGAASGQCGGTGWSHGLAQQSYGSP